MRKLMANQSIGEVQNVKVSSPDSSTVLGSSILNSPGDHDDVTVDRDDSR